MGECRGGGGDGQIKLFGKTIPVRGAGDVAKDLQYSGSSSTESDVQENTRQDTSPQPEVVDAEDPANADKSSPAESGDDAASQREKLKKPDKILPCPRCNSMDTKFCYFNNYNVNQPRHFCKNCQRYWTAGGAMRNVPVGAGRRKNKNAIVASHFLQRVRAALPGDPICGPTVKTNATVLSFGHDASSTLDLADQMTRHLNDNLIPVGRADPSMGSCSQVSSNRDKKQSSSENVTVEKSATGVQHPGMNAATMWQYGCAPSPTYYTSGIAIPIYPAAPAYWGCMVTGAWSLPWPLQSHSQALSSPTSAPSVSSGPNSLTLGKHPREGDEEGRGHGNGKVWVPKTIRIDNADEVARSSIRSLFGIRGGEDREETDTSGHKLATVFRVKAARGEDGRKTRGDDDSAVHAPLEPHRSDTLGYLPRGILKAICKILFLMAAFRASKHELSLTPLNFLCNRGL